MSARILLADDDSLAQDFLQSLLQSRGYTVDTANDGFAAIKMLRSQRYDLAMLDYHMPDLDGYAAARLLRDGPEDKAGTKLVAVTGDDLSLAARPEADTVFDAILPKNMEPQRLFRSIEALLHNPQRTRATEAALSAWQMRGLASRPRMLPLPQPSIEQLLAVDTCFEPSSANSADVVGLLDGHAHDRVSEWRAQAANDLVPVIAFSDEGAGACDAVFSVHDTQAWTRVAAAVTRFATRREHLRPEVRLTPDLDLRLLAYLYVAERSLAPFRDPQSRSFTRYPGFFHTEDVCARAERLVSRGLLRQAFVDRSHACPICRSCRLNVREECLSCRSRTLRNRR